jgi:hypothetical protein
MSGYRQYTEEEKAVAEEALHQKWAAFTASVETAAVS